MVGDILVYATTDGFLMSALKQYVGRVQVGLDATDQYSLEG